MLTDEQFAEFNRIANEVSNVIGNVIIDAAEARNSDELDPSSIFYAAVNGAITAAVRVFDASNKAMPVKNADDMFDGLVRQMVDVWGQCRGQPAQLKGTVQ